MLIAIASKSGTEVDQHFGHAEKFRIYSYRQGNPLQISEVAVEKYCSLDPEHLFRPMPLAAIANALQDCRVVVSAMIGERPKRELEELGFTVISMEGPIAAALKLAHDTVCKGKCGNKIEPCVPVAGSGA